MNKNSFKIVLSLLVTLFSLNANAGNLVSKYGKITPGFWNFPTSDTGLNQDKVFATSAEASQSCASDYILERIKGSDVGGASGGIHADRVICYKEFGANTASPTTKYRALGSSTDTTVSGRFSSSKTSTTIRSLWAGCSNSNYSGWGIETSIGLGGNAKCHNPQFEGKSNGRPCTSNSECFNNNCAPRLNNEKFCAAPGKECSLDTVGADGYEAGREVVIGSTTYRCQETGGLIALVSNGSACTSDSACRSNRCRSWDSSTKYCVASGKECGKSGTDGFDLNYVILEGTTSKKCMGTDPNAKFENNPLRSLGAVCTADNECVSPHRCRLGGPANSVKYCVASGNECGWEGLNGFTANAVKYTGEGDSKKAYKCNTGTGFREMTKANYNCPAVVKATPSSSIDNSKYVTFPTKGHFKDVPFYQIYLTKSVLRCYYGYGTNESQVGYLEINHGAGENCSPSVESDGNIYTKTRKTFSCWK